MKVGDPAMESRSEGETVVVPNTFKEVMGLAQAKQWKAATEKETDSVMRHKLYDVIHSNR